MSKFTLVGLLSALAGGVILLFQFISSLMQEGTGWQQMRLVDIIPSDQLVWVERIDWVYVRSALDYVINMPLFMLLFCLAIILFIIAAFRKP